MAKGNMIYSVVVYIGDFMSHDTRVIYTCSKESQAQRYLHTYLKSHPDVSKAYIERSTSRHTLRETKRMREDDEE